MACFLRVQRFVTAARLTRLPAVWPSVHSQHAGSGVRASLALSRCYSAASKKAKAAASAAASGAGKASTPAKCDNKSGQPGRYVLHLEDLGKITQGRPIFQDLNLSMFYGAKIGILGINGSGKSTFIKILAGVDDEYEGVVNITDGMRVGYLSQEPELDPELDVKGNVFSGSGVAEKKAVLDQYFEMQEEVEALQAIESPSPEEVAKLEDLRGRLAVLQRVVDDQKLLDLALEIERAMDALRCPPGDRDVTTLSGGERRRVALCRLLISAPDLLLLDEPTNHLDAESVAWLERFLADFKGTVIAITHDRYFLDNITGWILEFDRGQAIPYKGCYSDWIEAKQKRLVQEAAKDTARSRLLERELDWIKKGKHVKNKARVREYEKLLKDTSALETATPGTIVFPPGPRLGNTVIEVRNLCKSYGDKLLFDDLTFTLTPGAIVGVVGANGSGKTSLFNVLAGYEQPDSGTVSIGTSVRMAYVSQSRMELNPDNTIYDEIAQGSHTIHIGLTQMATRGYVSAFNFKGEAQAKRVGVLSGGERNRVQLAKALKEGPNLIMLDEPTNDLDVEVLRNLENALDTFPGCAVVISHDRWFLDRICTHILAFEGNGKVVYFPGNYAEYEADKRRKLGRKEDDGNKKTRYKKIEHI
eukprot:TRINITY_DN27057_c0_g1_i1.p1 TRINITY_DN27057_c0_g1~~TRINITY_DN27057_c0_g1_i1.p1  ORF type:complete len:645 (-),score=196.07 TRINITY_DN27057_c0_g1_i1:179-2113(-)